MAYAWVQSRTHEHTLPDTCLDMPQRLAHGRHSSGCLSVVALWAVVSEKRVGPADGGGLVSVPSVVFAGVREGVD